MSPLKFRARIELSGVNPFVWLRVDHVSRLAPGQKRPIPVIVRVNGQPEGGWRVNAMPVGDGTFRLYLNGIVRGASRTSVGDLVRIEVAADSTYRGGPTHEMPAAFKIGLTENEAAARAWAALTPSRQKEVLRYIAGLKGGQARERNIQLALRVLGGARGRFLGRDWNAPGENRRMPRTR